MKKFAVALLLLVLAAPAVFAGSWRNVVIEHAQADYRNNEGFVVVKLDNGFKDADNMKFTAVIPELGARQRVGSFSLGLGEEKTKTAVMHLGDAGPGEYVVRITISDSGIRRIKHRFITII